MVASILRPPRLVLQRHVRQLSMAQVITIQEFKSFLRISIRTWLMDRNPCETSHFLAIGILTQRCSTSAFNSAKHSGGSQSQSVRRSFAIASRVRSSRSSHRPDNTAARSWSTASAFPSSQNRLVPFSRRLSTRRIVLSIAPLPSGTPRHRKQSYRSRPASECRIK